MGSHTVCPFCQKQTIDDEFRTQIEAFFDGEYAANMDCIAKQLQIYKEYTALIISAFKTQLANKRKCSIAKLDEALFLSKLELLEKTFKNNTALIESKHMEPGRSVVLERSDTLILELLALIDSANSEIAKHNNMVRNLSEERKRLTNDIWTYFMDEQESLIASYLADDKRYEKALGGMQQKLISLKAELGQLRDEIAAAGKNITSVQPTVDEINRSLVFYGFDNFSIAASHDNPNMYHIQRPDGTLVSNTLSEGEETFIAFLYFMQLTKGSTNTAAVSNKRILVLDDPICSLDSNILYVVSAMVKQLLREVKMGASLVEQVFILTHNVFFHKEASFVNGRSNGDREVNYWILQKNNGISSFVPYGMNNPISTSYELLWQELRSNTQASPIAVQNTMRRIIENYFGMLGTSKEDYCVEKFTAAEDQIICRSLFHWINDGSHSIPDDLFLDSYSLPVNRYKEIFKRIFIETGHEAHYNMMMQIV